MFDITELKMDNICVLHCCCILCITMFYNADISDVQGVHQEEIHNDEPAAATIEPAQEQTTPQVSDSITVNSQLSPEIHHHQQTPEDDNRNRSDNSSPVNSANVSTSSSFHTPETIRPFPVAARVSNQGQTSTNNRKKRKSVIATSSPYKAELLENEIKKKSKCKLSFKKKENEVRPNAREIKKCDKKKIMKKMTCRADKPRGRKPNQSKTKKVQSNLNADSQDAECLVCNERFVDSLPGEKWVQCQRCNGWCHEDCASDADVVNFVCDFCI